MFPVGGGGGHFDPNLNRAVRLNPQMSRSCQFKIWLKWDLDLDKDGGEVDRDGEVGGLTLNTVFPEEKGIFGSIYELANLKSFCFIFAFEYLVTVVYDQPKSQVIPYWGVKVITDCLSHDIECSPHYKPPFVI